MKIAIVGDGEAERAWIEAVRRLPDTELVEPWRPVDVLILGGPRADRVDALRRNTVDGPVVICLHPPGPDDASYLQASGRVVPDLPLRLHPAVPLLKRALEVDAWGTIRSVVHEVPARSGDLIDVFARSIDVLRALLGEFETLTASGEADGPEPSADLAVRLHSRSGRLAEVRIARDAGTTARLTIFGSAGSLQLEYDPTGATLDSRLDARLGDASSQTFLWSPYVAMLDALGRASFPTLDDGVRAMELTQAVRRSLRRRRTVEIHPAPLSAEAAFKSSMVAGGCLLLAGSATLFAAASAARALGIESASKLVLAIPPALAAFLIAAWRWKPADVTQPPHQR